MAFSSFEHFAAALCEAAGVSLPSLEPDPAGMVAFQLTTRGVRIDLAHWAAPANDDMFMLANFGPIPEGHELAAMRLLAEANFELLSPTAPVFGRAPGGEVVLRQLVSLATIDVAGALRTIRNLADLTLRWRANPAMTPTGSRPHDLLTSRTYP